MITSFSNPRVRQIVQWQNKARERRSAGIFLTEGFKLFEEAPRESILQVYLSEDALERAAGRPETGRKLNDVGYETVTGDVFKKMSDTQTPQGILCVVRRPEYSMEQLLRAEMPLLMALEDIQDPGNLGTIVRTGEAAGITGVIMSAGTVDIFNPKTIRATMGSVFRVPFLYVDSLPQTIGILRQRGIHTYAAHLEGKAYYDELSFREPTAFLVGNEANGLNDDTAACAEQYLRIPMEGKTESLNAAIAASLLLYEAYRQRRKH
ncbi:MAG: RNA methyltransferase [Blautia sp.]|nr:RNA methyltransferase [Blautia sp.]